MKRAFTLLELLVVVGIMGLLGTVSVGGYRQMRRGMEEKGVIQDVNTLIRAAYQRAQIDRQPTAVIFWNETLRAESDTDDGNIVVVGHAVAIRRSGRITQVVGTDLLDEFADLELTNQAADEENGSSRATMYLYPMHDLSKIESSSQILRSTVETKVYPVTQTPVYLTDNGVKSETVAGARGGSSRAALTQGEASGSITVYAYRLKDNGGVTWAPGMAYGFEFAHIILPHGYIFGSNFSPSSSDPIEEAGAMAFDVGLNTGSGMNKGASGGLGSVSSISISALLPNSAGVLQPKKIGTTADPTSDL